MELPTVFQNYIALSRYARFIDEKNRREIWGETVTRYLDYLERWLRLTYSFELGALRNEIGDAIMSLEVMPSMRSLLTSGVALDRCHVGAYNCSYLPIDHVRCFDEAMYILLSGAGIGFSVEYKNISKLPVVNEHFERSDTTIVVEDSKAGWCKALRELLAMLYSGRIPKFNTDKVRPAGARLKTFGGRASGPGPLNELFHFCIKIFVNAAGRKLTSIEVHDIMCFIGKIVVLGSVRRSAEISMSDVDDEKMRNAKSGEWWERASHRSLANNSGVFDTPKPPPEVFLREWLALYESKSGERGIINRYAFRKKAAENGRRVIGYKDKAPVYGLGNIDDPIEFGTNPCAEIILRPFGFCNLTEVVARPEDTEESLARKIRIATILGTFQSTWTNFKYLRSIWKKNAEEERLLGVSITGILDNTLLSGRENLDQLPAMLERLKQVAIDVNKEYAGVLGINPSAAITTVKPSGTSSSLVDSASGIHPRHAPFFIRRVRADVKDPLTTLMKNQGVVWEKDAFSPDTQVVFSFPMKSPKDAVCRNGMTALEHADLWLTYYRHWTEHKPSITISYSDAEFIKLGNWVYEHFDEVSGIAFLPRFENETIYTQLPFEEVSEEQYEELLAKTPKSIDWTKLTLYETEDMTTSTQEFACVAGGCNV